jgi:hypothetical protein
MDKGLAMMLLGALALVAVAVGSRSAGAAGSVQQPRAAEAAQGFAGATVAAGERLRLIRDRAFEIGEPDVVAAKRCLADWRAAPQARRDELFRFYEIAVSRAVFAAEEPAFARWLDDLDAVPGVGTIGPLRDARRALARQLAFVRGVFANVNDPCAAVGAWRSAGWRDSTEPPIMVDVRRSLMAGRRAGSAWSRAILRGARLLERRGGPIGRRGAVQMRTGIGLPDVFDTCEPVLIVLAPDEVFCG